MDKVLRSAYAEHILEMIKLKRQLGYKFETGAYQLYKIDKFAYQTGEKGPGITREFAVKWLNLFTNQKRTTIYSRAMVLIQLACYISDLGIETHIPRYPAPPRKDFTPFIFSQDEIQRLFKAADNLVYSRNGQNVNLFSIPLMLRFLYSTGIRKGEAMDLLEEDVNLKERTILIRNSKNGGQRILPISETLASECEKYLDYKSELPINIQTTKHFFVGTLGTKISRNNLEVYYKRCISKLKLQPEGLNGFPRLHDLRHTFAVSSLTKMANLNAKSYTSLPLLMTYLGHTSITSTEKYLRLTSKIYPDIIRDSGHSYINIYPDIKTYETD
ncbi:tyrosine-type recombinase/integrase [Cellulophaga baltica]|uniref:tyrosine-type recombinase/integrase n=1 Tax=Cellulophaga baltica TaxID=76594 RepID=UPI002494AB27|nr:tyrosine-type recombinase/integrase [Cellulophaga baltica]